MMSEDYFNIADKAIERAYPDCDSKGKGWWGAQRIPNYGILRGAIEQYVREALAEKDTTIASLREENEGLKVEKQGWAAEIRIKELEAENKKLKSAVSAHIKVCRGWFGDDPVWEQIIAHNEWEGECISSDTE